MLIDLGSADRDLAFVGMPGEPFVEFQMQLRAKSPLPNFVSHSATPTDTSPICRPSPRRCVAATARIRQSNHEVGTGERMLDTGLISIYELLGMLSETPGKPRELQCKVQEHSDRDIVILVLLVLGPLGAAH